MESAAKEESSASERPSEALESSDTVTPPGTEVQEKPRSASPSNSSPAPVAQAKVIDPHTDRYGFMVGDKRYTKRLDKEKPAEVWLENSRTQKWLSMMLNWKSFATKHPALVKKRIRKGIPEAVRGKMWVLLSGADVLMDECPGQYAHVAQSIFLLAIPYLVILVEHFRSITCFVRATGQAKAP